MQCDSVKREGEGGKGRRRGEGEGKEKEKGRRREEGEGVRKMIKKAIYKRTTLSESQLLLLSRYTWN